MFPALTIWFRQQFAQAQKEVLFSPAVRQQLNSPTVIALKSHDRIAECWQPHFMFFRLSFAKVMSSPLLLALDLSSQKNYIMTPKLPVCHIQQQTERYSAKIYFLCLLILWSSDIVSVALHHFFSLVIYIFFHLTALREQFFSFPSDIFCQVQFQVQNFLEYN